MAKKPIRKKRTEFGRLLKESRRPQNIKGAWTAELLSYQIEEDLCNALKQCYLGSNGVFLAYREEHMPELIEAVKLYKIRNPKDLIQYLGLDKDDGKYTVQIAPDLKWLFTIRNSIPNLTFTRICHQT